MSSGERVSQLYEQDDIGFPLFYPTAFVARTLRINTTHSTQKVYLAAIKRVLEWEHSQKTDLAFRLHCHNFLSASEVDNLAAYIRRNKSGNTNDIISPSKFNTYLGYAAEYIRWLSYEVILETNNRETKYLIDHQNKLLLRKKIRKHGSRSARTQKIIDLRLPETARKMILYLFNTPYINTFPNKNTGQRLRNIIMLRILYETGMRIGEVLSLKLKNRHPSEGDQSAWLSIERNHNDQFDTRRHQPVAKTDGRIVPITSELETQLIDYIVNWRAEIPGVGFSDDDFIFIVHRKGHNQGQALSIKAFESGLKNLKQIHPELNPVYPHLFRHDWNYRFSVKSDEAGLNDVQERSLREKLMGWQPGSEMSSIYNQRHIQEKALELGFQTASDSRRRENE